MEDLNPSPPGLWFEVSACWLLFQLVAPGLLRFQTLYLDIGKIQRERMGRGGRGRHFFWCVFFELEKHVFQKPPAVPSFHLIVQAWITLRAALGLHAHLYANQRKFLKQDLASRSPGCLLLAVRAHTPALLRAFSAEGTDTDLCSRTASPKIAAVSHTGLFAFNFKLIKIK